MKNVASARPTPRFHLVVPLRLRQPLVQLLHLLHQLLLPLFGIPEELRQVHLGGE